MEVKIETDSNDAVEIKTEAVSNDLSEYPCDDGPRKGMFTFLSSKFIPLLFFYSTHNLTPCLVCFCLSSLCVSIEQYVYLYITVLCTTAVV